MRGIDLIVLVLNLIGLAMQNVTECHMLEDLTRGGPIQLDIKLEIRAVTN